MQNTPSTNYPEYMGGDGARVPSALMDTRVFASFLALPRAAGADASTPHRMAVCFGVFGSGVVEFDANFYRSLLFSIRHPARVTMVDNGNSSTSPTDGRAPAGSLDVGQYRLTDHGGGLRAGMRSTSTVFWLRAADSAVAMVRINDGKLCLP